ncbi:MAG: 50S ribosomal protein L35 [Ignavibacteriae bacterium]|nr:50S ribosomal protein L35 [Ignavibacteria bacterium]MBI3365496.1 50S ribosomal protein L35 [Ignavibacteriota bacterium]
MPKMKTNSGAKKRFTTTASGKLKRHKAFRSHILSSKSQKRKRHLRKATLVSPEEQRRLHILIQS